MITLQSLICLHLHDPSLPPSLYSSLPPSPSPSFPSFLSSLSPLSISLTTLVATDQRLKLSKNTPDDEEIVRGQLICEYIRER